MSLRPDLVACWIYRLGTEGDPEILLIRRAPGRMYPGLWQCVTGKLEAGESIVAGALREVAEEVGFKGATVEAFFETDIVNFFHEGSVDAVLSEAVFAARVGPAAEVRLSHEHDAARWLTVAAAKALVTWPAYERAIDFVDWLVANPARAESFRLLVDSAS